MFTLATIPNGSTTYRAITEANRVKLESIINQMLAQISAVGGDGAQLILDAFDRDGKVGAASYQLDVENYTGGPTIDIGRRPVFDAAKGDQDLSIAFGTYGGTRQRVSMSGDATLDASGIIDALPKTIYVAVPSDGTPQLYEDAGLPDLVYLYSATWDGYSLTEITEIGHTLPGFTLIQELVKAASCDRIFDGSTDWLSELESRSTLVFAGDGTESETGLNFSRKIVGGFIALKGDEDGFFAPEGPDNKLVLELWDDEDRRWNLEEIELDLSATPTRLFFTIDPSLGSDLYVTKVREFRLVRSSIGVAALSAKNYSWGLYTVPVIGTPVPRNESKVDGI